MNWDGPEMMVGQLKAVLADVPEDLVVWWSCSDPWMNSSLRSVFTGTVTEYDLDTKEDVVTPVLWLSECSKEDDG